MSISNYSLIQINLFIHRRSILKASKVKIFTNYQRYKAIKGFIISLFWHTKKLPRKATKISSSTFPLGKIFTLCCGDVAEMFYLCCANAALDVCVLGVKTREKHVAGK